MKIIRSIFVVLAAYVTLSTTEVTAGENPFQSYIAEYDVVEASRCVVDYVPVDSCQMVGVGVRPDGENGLIYIYEMDGQGLSVGYPLFERVYEDELGREEAKIDRPSGNTARWTRSVSLVNGLTKFESRTLMRNEAGVFVYRYASRELPMFGDERTIEIVYQLRKSKKI